ncbi:DNA recombination protein RmuC [Stutzerimonas stutzeri]|uniref:DNA recombination protein RmuC n=1 Tax=Stutzerimonas stutzeri TaxID=316 RepID=UPI001C8CE2AE|nr:DNA recombination protein RmuC [Stutzerimonas stutzeri]MCQ4238877.1 DNA recombination protein RmuC [Stutzerimonas stutzeri]MDI9727873.1 DNA recombination protein RmuC [Stutzerimonas stutzeri]MDI9747535.1 DNA recombination protein RmuC [Stutzerimonas stutzeri]CAB5522128.1 DNA recombination protein rmuC [Stutzerimonas stutzeri]CAB5583295.1 DNA recombination protein rmuC [Stutzerimonas stutzeri]
MQASQWTTEIIVISAVLALASLVIGYFIATLRQGRQIGTLTAQLEQAQQGQASAMAASTALSEQLKAAEARSQELQVAESTLKAKLQAAFDNVTRLNHELQESKDAKAAQNLKLEDANRQHHETAKRLETAQADSRSLHEQVTDLRDRLSTAQAAITSLQGERDNLKNELASLDASAKVAATGEREAREQLAEIRQQLASRTQQYNELLGRYQPLSNQHAELNTSLQKREELVAELRDRLNAAEAVNAQLQADRDQLKDSLANEGKRSQSLATSEREVREQLQDIKAQQVAAAERYEALHSRFTAQSSEYTKLKTELDEREASHARELANFEQQKASLSEQFKLLSNEILEAKTQALQESSKLSLSAVMTPFQQSIDTFKREVQEIHHRETTQQGELRKELESLKALNQQITTEAHELSTALRGQKKLQGNWGELVLENVLDRSGLQKGKDYDREVSFTTEEGRQRPDAVVYLPQGKHLIIDAKVSLNAYTRFVNAEDEGERAIALKEHVQAVGNRIKELADRDYYKLPGLNSPDMVFMFIPIESAFVEALKADETLFQRAIENNVLVATPTTLLTSLNIVRQLWRYEDQNKHTAALASRAEAVFKKLNTFLASFEKIKKGLETATEAYVKAEGQLVSGKGNLVKQVGEFKNLAPAIKAQLPAYFADKAALEIDFIPTEQSIEVLTDSADDEELLAEADTETDYETA